LDTQGGGNKKGRATCPAFNRNELTGILFYGILQRFGRYEFGHHSGFDLYLGAGLGIAADSGFTLGGFEAAETGNLHGLIFFQGVGDSGKNTVNNFLSLFFG
jgi:hypothetical protein